MKAFRTPIAAVTNQVFLCGVGCINTENLKNKGISHVLNTAEELEDFKYPDLNLQVRHILMRDSPDQDLLKFLDICIDHINDVQQAGGHILVHCVAGVSRSASVCIAYLMKYKRMSLHKAYYHIFNKRPCIHPNFGFWRQLVQFEIDLTGESSVELLPFILGEVPDIMKRDAEYRIKMAWMPDLISMFSIHFIILFMQILSLYFLDNAE
ncbi:Hexaprenyldihydroxybenzoate methyltransferase [Mactra antiquata]